jgi:hypothetical protein
MVRRYLDICQAMLDEIPAYLNSDVVYWQLHADRSYPMLTIAGLLFHQHVLQAQLETLSTAEQTQLANLQHQWQTLQRDWLSNLTRKAAREWQGRMHSWQWYLQDHQTQPKQAQKHYPEEVQTRIYLEILKDFLQKDPSFANITAQLAQADQQLRQNWQPGPFVRPAEVQIAFPAEHFWFLYGLPRADSF